VLTVDGILGCVEFGWGPSGTKISDVWSRLNFAYLQANYVNNKENQNTAWLAMLEDCLRQHCGVEKVEWLIGPYGGYLSDDPDDKVSYAYIDHQSCSYEGENTEMFDSAEELNRFIFGAESSITLDNDNE
jgi:hypothetical protein